jgi:hypothetical protein
MAMAIPLGSNNMEFLVIGLIIGLILEATVVYLYSDYRLRRKEIAKQMVM